MGGSYFSVGKITPQSLRGYEGGRAVVSAQSKPVVKSEEELRKEDMIAILARAQALLANKIVWHKVIYNPEEERDGIWIKYEGQENDTLEKKREIYMKLIDNRDSIIKDSVFFEAVDLI
jgi:hypothetical protein